MRFIEIPALITEDIEDPNIVDITETETVTASISGTTLTINGDSKVSGETTITLTGDVTVDAIIKENLRQPSIHKIIIKTNGAGNFTYVPNNTVTASSVSTTTKTGSDLEILLITTSGGDTYLDLDVADYVSPAANFSNVLTGFNVSELTSTYGATAKLYKPGETSPLATVSATTGSGVNFGYTESLPGDVEYKLEVTDDLGRKSTYNLPRKWINYAMGTTSTPGFQKFRLEGIDDDYTTTVMFPSLGSSSTAKVYRTSDHGYLGINFKIQGRNSTGDDWVDIANADEDDEVLAFGDFLYHRVWVKPTAKATTTVSSSNVVTITLSNLTEENVTTSFTGADPFDINESTNTYVFEETTKIGTVPYTVTLGSETYTNAVTVTTEGTAYDYVTLAFANPTLSLTTSNVTISSAKLYRDDVLFHTYGTESNVVLRSDQTGTYQAIVNDVYYSNRITPDFTTTRSVSAPQLVFDGYNKLHLSNSTPTSTTLGLPDGTTRDLTTQSNVYIYETGTYTANVQTSSDTFAYLSNVVTSQPSQNSADVGPTFTFDGYNRLNLSNLTQTSSTLKYGSKTYDTNTASNVYVTDTGEYILEAKDANTFVMSNVYVGAVSQHPSDVVPTLTFDGYNKLTIDNVDTVETATIKKDGAAFATTTSNTVYIRDTGTYTAEVKGSNVYAIELSKVVSAINNAPDWRETQFQLLYSENPNQNDRFGSVVDIDGDYACIGSGYDDTNAVDKGAVYVFHKSNGVWTYQDILQPDSTSEDFAVLNSSLSIHGDTIAAGAQANDTGGNDFGAVYVFRRNGTSWSKEAKLQTNDVQTSDNFGSGVGIYGDYIVGGAYAEDTGGSRAGSAYIFKRTGTTWEQTAKIQSGDQSIDDKFGLNCKIYGDYVIVGAPEEDIGGSEYGAAYIFKRDALSRPTTNVIVLSPADWGSPAQHFHRNPSLDTTTSSFYELVQGTSWGTGTTTDTGHGIELRLNGTNTELYVNSDNNNLDPITVSIGDGTASSSVTLISGQTCTLYKADGTGYSFTVNSGHLFGEVWSKTETLLASDGASGDFFGQSVDIYDGYAIVGASIKDYNDGTNTGGAYIFKKNVDESWTEQAILISDDPIDNYQFGASVYIKGNYAIVGEPGSTNTGGFMYVFERSGSTWTQIKKFQVTNGQDANFGTSVAISGDTILSGAPYDDVKDVNTGVCYVFSKTPPGSYVTFDNYNKITLNQLNYEDTATVSDPNGSTYNLGTAKTMYVKDAGEYVLKISGTDKYVESNVYVSSVDLEGAPTKPIDFDGYNKLTLIDAGSNVSANVTYFSNTYELGSANVLYINGAGTYDLEMSGSNVFALSSNIVGAVSTGVIANPVFTSTTAITTNTNWTSGSGWEVTADSTNNSTDRPGWKAF